MKQNHEAVHGETEGIRRSVLDQLAALYQAELEEDAFLPRDLMRELARLSCQLNREIAVYITRDGEIVEVCVGTSTHVTLSDWRTRRSPLRLSGVRCVHTHPGGDGTLSDVDISALKDFRYDAMVAVGVRDGEPTNVQAAFLISDEEVRAEKSVLWYRVPDEAWLRQILESDQLVGREKTAASEHTVERAVLMGIESEESLAELARLAETAGAEVVASFLQKRDKPDNATLIGKGRLQTLTLECQALEADVVIFDEELTGIMVRNLEQQLRLKVIDRTTLILDIFAQRAVSAEGKLQVEMAQLQYQSARLIGQGVVLSRLAGGIGTRGPGETQLEMDRRRIRSRITELRRRIDSMEKQRELRRKTREKNELPVVALVGYTNAGKSSLLNALSGAEVYEADQLFATLDAVGRRLETDEKTPYLLVDTVGFIRKLPHALVDAFRSTLEEAALADILVIVSDGASPDMLTQHATVCAVLQELGAVDQPRIEVINKADLNPNPPMLPGAVQVSARTGAGLDQLQTEIATLLQQSHAQATFFVPFTDYAALGTLRTMGRVVSEVHTDTGTEITLVLSAADRERAMRLKAVEVVG